MTTNLHAHLESRTVDCDGPLDRTWVMSIERVDRERAHRPGQVVDDSSVEHQFRNRVLASVVNLNPLHAGYLNVAAFDDGTSRLSWTEGTDEGHRAVEALFCTDDCDTEARSQRDHYAEAMGY